MRPLYFATFLCAATPAIADDYVSDFVQSNIVATLYHELGHALIDKMRLPVFGQEEDAADVLSVLMIDQLFDEEAAVAMAYDTALGFWNSSLENPPVFWSVHGADEQRFFNTVCLFYGGDVDEREDVAHDLGLPDERAETCQEEFELANDSWGGVLDELAQGDGVLLALKDLETDADGAEFAHRVLAEEIEALNKDFAIQPPIEVDVDECGVANAFYFLDTQSITICAEFVGFLATLAEIE